MNIKIRTIIFAVLAACIPLTVSMAQSQEADPYPTIILPVYQGAYDIENSVNRLKGMTALNFKIQTSYPATEVLEYYDAVLNGRGWRPSFEICQRHWASQDDGSIKKEFHARQLFTSWDHPQYRLQISLLLEYQPPGTKSRDEVIVHCRLQPQLDKSKHDNFISRLKESGQYIEFNQKLDTYRQPDGELDSARIARDIRNKTDDDNLTEYMQIRDEMKQEIDDIIRRINETR